MSTEKKPSVLVVVAENIACLASMWPGNPKTTQCNTER